MISVETLEKRYDELVAATDVRFDIAKGEIVGLLGQNGAGKTTVMKMITGYLEPTAGTVKVGGIDVREDRLGVQRQIGYMPESAPLYREMLVQEYLLMLAELRGIPSDKRVSAVAEAIRATGLEDRVTQVIGTLSKGYRQRVGLAQAILHKPEVLVLDEPTNGLDPVQIVEIRELIRRLAETTTVILSTHILSEIEAVCNRVIILIDGRVAADSDLEALLSSNVIRIALHDDDAEVENDILSIEGVETVTRDDVRNGITTWRAVCTEGALPTDKIIKMAQAKSWKINAIAPETPSLEQAFRDLMADHVSKARQQEGEA